MKGLKKIALVTAIAAAPFAAQAELTALDDVSMGNMTGQAGVTIELETLVTIGEFKYTDEGSLSVKNITLGGAAAAGLAGFDLDGDGTPEAFTNKLDNLKADIDINAAGDAVVSVGTTNGLPIDFGLTMGSVDLVSQDGLTTSTLISNVAVAGLLFQLDITVQNQAVPTLNVVTEFTVLNLNADVDFLAAGIAGMSITGNGSHGGAILDIDLYKGTNAAGADALVVDLGTVEMDINIASVSLGGVSIGSVAMNDVALTGTVLKVYGH